jgi:hypothetical protein
MPFIFTGNRENPQTFFADCVITGFVSLCQGYRYTGWAQVQGLGRN